MVRWLEQVSRLAPRVHAVGLETRREAKRSGRRPEPSKRYLQRIKMPSFSERMGLVEPNEIFQIDSMDQALKNGLWNALIHYLDQIPSEKKLEIWTEFLKETADTFQDDIPFMETNSDWYSTLRRWFLEEAHWNEVYDFIEFIFEFNSISGSDGENATSEINRICKRENSAYRLIDGQFASVTDATEVNELVEVVSATSTEAFTPVREHLKCAMQMLSDRENPDYRNSIKESISAVESITNILSGKKHNGMKSALDKLEKQGVINLHPALKSAFEKMYGYTSDENGIRHALMGESNVRYEDAKYMLVVCSSFVNYLIAKTAP